MTVFPECSIVTDAISIAMVIAMVSKLALEIYDFYKRNDRIDSEKQSGKK